MIPKLYEWRTWGALERATYFAQLIAPITLVVTSCFSYMSWVEAKSALTLQQKLFTAQNSPRINVSGAYIQSSGSDDHTLVINGINDGESMAFNLCLTLERHDETVWSSTCTAKDPIGFSVHKGEEWDAALPLPIIYTGKIDLIPVSAKVMKPGSVADCTMDRTEIVFIKLRYQDAVGNVRGASQHTTICGPVRN